ncbi:MAG: hypothetical protein ACFHWX_05550 [Bacteroidota bacterium]
MKLILGVTVFLLLSQALFAQQNKQDSSNLQVDSLKAKVAKEETTEKKAITWSIYIEYNPEYGPQPGQYGFHQQIGAGLTYRKINLGVFTSYLRDGITRMLIFPNEFDLIYLYGGGYLGTVLYLNQKFDIVIRYSFSKGGMVWENSETKLDLVRENFFLSKPEVVVQYKPVNFFSVFSTAGYKIGHGLDIPGVDKNGLNGFAISFGVRLGYFHFKP